MIFGNSLHWAKTSLGTGFLSCGRRLEFPFLQTHFNTQVHKSTSYPAGYRLNAVYMPIAEGGISGKTAVNTTSSANIIGDGYIQGNLTITISTSASGDLLANINGTCNITITTSGNIIGIGYVQGTLNIGAQPSAEDIAQAVWQMQLPGGFSSGSAGSALGAVGSGADPWSTILPGTYTGDQAGKILADLETLIKQVKALTAAQL